MSPLDRIAQLTAQLELVAQSEADLREANRKLEREAQELRCQLVTARELTDRLSADVHRLAEEKREAFDLLACLVGALENHVASFTNAGLTGQTLYQLAQSRAFLSRHANP